MAITSLAHVCLKTTDLAATEAFYCDVIGLEKYFHFTKEGQTIGFYMKAGNDTFIEVFLSDYAPRDDRQPLHHFCLQTDTIEILRAKLAFRGYDPGPIKIGADQTPQFWIKDPSGNAIEFQEYRLRSSQLTGRDVEIDW